MFDDRGLAETMNYPLLIILGLAPSIIWLLFYLRQDKHPEPNRMVLKIFIFGMLAAPLAFLLQLVLLAIADQPSSLKELFSGPRGLTAFLLNIIVFAPLVEEYLKYAVVKTKVLATPDFDEPLDAMLYCIIAALGFAAVENLLIVLQLSLKEALFQMSARFLSATFLHALASGIVGFWLAISILYRQHKIKFLTLGLALAIFCHSLYNYLIWRWEVTSASWLYLLLIVLLLLSMAGLVFYQFKRLKKLLSICKI